MIEILQIEQRDANIILYANVMLIRFQVKHTLFDTESNINSMYHYSNILKITDSE